MRGENKVNQAAQMKFYFHPSGVNPSIFSYQMRRFIDISSDYSAGEKIEIFSPESSLCFCFEKW